MVKPGHFPELYQALFAVDARHVQVQENIIKRKIRVGVKQIECFLAAAYSGAFNVRFKSLGCKHKDLLIIGIVINEKAMKLFLHKLSNVYFYNTITTTHLKKTLQVFWLLFKLMIWVRAIIHKVSNIDDHPAKKFYCANRLRCEAGVLNTK